MIQRFMDEDTLEAVQNLRPIAQDLGLTMPQLAIAWVLQNPNVAAAIVGASRPKQLEETVKASGVEIPQEAMWRIGEVLSGVAHMDPEETYSVSPKTRP